ncbi:MAG: cell division protein SepF [Actinomycetaceae bacterium]|nr:cell division protein SepF [Actinomycetaceae bacterium]
MGMFQRFVDKATLSDDAYDEYGDEGYEDEYLEEGLEEEAADVTPIRSVASAPDLARIVTVWPKTFNDVQGFADQFRKGLPVILNLSGAEESARYRIVDFALGVCYGLHGHLNQISGDVLLMTPRTVKMETHRPEQADRF